MNYLRENLFHAAPMDRNLEPHRFKSVQAIPRAAPRVLDRKTARLLDRNRNPLQRIDDFLKLDGGADLVAGTAGLVFQHEGELAVLLRMRPGPDGFEKRALPKQTAIWPAIWIYFDFAHDHHTGVVFHVPWQGRPSARTIWGCEGLLASDSQQGTGRQPIRGGWKSQSLVIDRAWHVLLTLKLDRFSKRNVTDQPVIGFQVMRLESHRGHCEESSWNYSRIWRPIPSCFGELALGPSSLTVRSIDLREPIHGMNRAGYEITNHASRARDVVVHAALRSPHHAAEHRLCVQLPPRQTRHVRVPYETSLVDWRGQVVTFRIEDETGLLLYRASYRAGSCWRRDFGGSYLQLKHRLPFNVPRGQPAPSWADPDYYRKKRLQILSNMPDFQRDLKAPQRAISGRIGARTVIRLDLERPGLFQRVAHQIARLFKSDDDRIIAALYFLNQTCTWSGTFNLGSAVSNPASSLRNGYPQCGEYVYMLAAILRHLTEQRTGRPFVAHYLGAHAHVVCAIDRDNDHVAVDPNLGFFFLSRDNTRLATLTELYDDPGLVRRVAPGRLADYAESRERCFLGRTMLNFPEGAAAR